MGVYYLNGQTGSESMSQFSRICKAMEEMDPDTYVSIVSEKSTDIIRALSNITEDGFSGLTIFIDFVLCAVAADGKLSEDEFYLIKPLLEKAVGMELTYEDGKDIFYAGGLDKPKDYNKTVKMMVDLLELVSPKLKEDIVLVCMMVCAVDGKISYKERKWINNLID